LQPADNGWRRAVVPLNGTIFAKSPRESFPNPFVMPVSRITPIYGSAANRIRVWTMIERNLFPKTSRSKRFRNQIKAPKIRFNLARSKERNTYARLFD
jgi:hypothetical protein